MIKATPFTKSRFVVLSLIAAGLCFTGPAAAQQMLQQEPGAGQLAAGSVVYVDDGACPKGQIKQVTGGSNIGAGGVAVPGSGRQRKCIRRPS